MSLVRREGAVFGFGSLAYTISETEGRYCRLGFRGEQGIVHAQCIGADKALQPNTEIIIIPARLRRVSNSVEHSRRQHVAIFIVCIIYFTDVKVLNRT